METRAFDFLKGPVRQPKPRTTGMNISGERCMPLGAQRDLCQAHHDIIDCMKVADNAGICFRYPAKFLREKNNIYREYGIVTYPGGIVFQVAYLQGMTTQAFKKIKELGYDGVEIAEDALSLTGQKGLHHPIPNKKLKDLIREALSLGLEVHGEIGTKWPTSPLNPAEAAELINFEIEAGAHGVTIEGSEITLLVEKAPEALLQLSKMVPKDKVFYEVAPGPWSQNMAWLLNNVAPDVNIENIPLEELTNAEALRYGFGRAQRYGFLGEKLGKV